MTICFTVAVHRLVPEGPGKVWPDGLQFDAGG
jgi:hypothetical protein